MISFRTIFCHSCFSSSFPFLLFHWKKELGNSELETRVCFWILCGDLSNLIFTWKFIYLYIYLYVIVFCIKPSLSQIFLFEPNRVRINVCQKCRNNEIFINYDYYTFCLNYCYTNCFLQAVENTPRLGIEPPLSVNREQKLCLRFV